MQSVWIVHFQFLVSFKTFVHYLLVKLVILVVFNVGWYMYVKFKIHYAKRVCLSTALQPNATLLFTQHSTRDQKYICLQEFLWFINDNIFSCWMLSDWLVAIASTSALWGTFVLSNEDNVTAPLQKVKMIVIFSCHPLNGFWWIWQEVKANKRKGGWWEKIH